jgi:hypothetical protein
MGSPAAKNLDIFAALGEKMFTPQYNQSESAHWAAD